MLLSLWVLGAAGLAEARERLAVLIVVVGDPALADNLTEVVISKLAEGRDRELVGLRELRVRLADVLKGESVDACLARPTCLSAVGAAAAADRALVGTLRRGEHDFAATLAVTDIRTGVARVEAVRKLPVELTPLISALRNAVEDLFREQRAPGVEARTPRATAGTANLSLARAGSRQPFPDLTPQVELRSRASAPLLSYLTYGLAASAVVAFSAAAVTGSLATATPIGKTRAATQNDVERRKDYATLATGLYAAGGTLVLAAAGIVVWRWP